MVLAIAAAGCRDEPAAPHACECRYLTDMDDEVKMREVVCAPSPARAAAVAKDCAARAAAAPVLDCTCVAGPDAVPCRTGECLSPAKRD